MHLKNKYTNSVFYIHKDHLGSIVAISSDDVDKNNGVVLEFNYDAWGHRTNTNGSLSFSSEEISRGYTGHEHIPEYALINMNGRVYDPLLARFLSPDNYVQMPDNSQNFNRFGYCLNNPLIYTDPSGDVVVLTAILVGAAIGIGVDYGVQVASNYLNHDNWRDALFNNVDFFDVAVSGAIGGLTAGYGSALSNGAKLGKFGMAIVNNSALIRLAEVGLTSAIDITGNGWQDISFKDFGTRAIVAGITFGISSALMPKAKPQLDNMPRSKNGDYVSLVNESRKTHIIAGDATGGGHAWFGSPKSFMNGLKGKKSMFPVTWSNSEIMNGVSEVVTSNPWIQQTGRAGAMLTRSGQPVRFVTEGFYRGIKIRVINTHSEIITAFPLN